MRYLSASAAGPFSPKLPANTHGSFIAAKCTCELMQSCVLSAIVNFRFYRNKRGIARSWMPSTELLKGLLPQKRADLLPQKRELANFDLQGLSERTNRAGGRVDRHTKGFGSESSVNITNDSLLRGPGRTKQRDRIGDLLGPASVDTADEPVLTAQIVYEVLSVALSNPFALFHHLHS